MGGFGALIAVAVDFAAAIRSHIVLEIGYAFLGLMFAVAATGKLRAPRLAALAIVDFGLARRPLPIFGFILGLCEALLAVGLITRWSPLLVSALASALLFCFTLLLASAWIRKREFPCRCLIGQASIAASLVRTFALLSLALLLYSSAELVSSDLISGSLSLVVAAGSVSTVLVMRSAIHSVRPQPVF